MPEEVPQYIIYRNNNYVSRENVVLDSVSRDLDGFGQFWVLFSFQNPDKTGFGRGARTKQVLDVQNLALIEI